MSLRSREKVSPAFSMSSMTDLVFLLLIFFIIVSTLVSPFALPVDLPTKSKSSSQSADGVVFVKIDANEQHFIDNRSVPVAAFEKALVRSVEGTAERKISLNVDQNASTGVMVNVLDIAKRNDCKIVLKTKAGQ